MVQVNVSEGILEGEVKNNEYGETYFSFKGIPYAQPPVGDLRFKAPQPLKPWQGVRSAKEHGPICYQVNLKTNTPPEGSEDCLFLNVYTPNIKPAYPLPVMVFIHGGAFLFGSGNSDECGPEFLVKENVILVTFNYRVGVLGFLCLDNEDIPGNAAMKDQVAVLRWVKKNISNFGGDPDNITVFGVSAGAASVVYHLLSPMSKGLFQKAIVQSGTVLCPWARSFESREKAIALAKKLGFDSEDDEELTKFFKSQPKENLLNINVPITLAESSNLISKFLSSVVSEKQFGSNERFFYGDVINALCNGIQGGVKVIVGYVEHEGTNVVFDREKIVSQMSNFKETFAPTEIAINCPIRGVLEAGRKMKKFYFGDENISMERFDKIEKFLGMNNFIYGVMEFSKMYSKSNETFLYKFTCKSERNRWAEDIVGHSDDTKYLFTLKMNKLDTNSKAFGMINNVVKLWTNFAKFGNPTPDSSLGVVWRPYNLLEQHYLDIGEKLVPGIAPDKYELEFWESLFREYYPRFVA